MRWRVRDETVRRVLRAGHPDVLRTALLLTGERRAAAELVEDAALRVLRRRAAHGLTVEGVRDEMARLSASGRTPAGRQVVDAVRLADRDDDLGPVAAALEQLPPLPRTVAVLRLTEDLSVDDVARVLGRSAEPVRAHEAEALARLVPAAGDPDRLPACLSELAALPPDDGAADRATGAVLARRRRRRAGVALAAVGLLAAVPLTVAVADRTAPPSGPAGQPAGEPVGPPVEVLTGPVRGSLAAEESFLAAARRAPWGAGDDPPLAAREVVFAADTLAGRVVLVVAGTAAGLDGAWLTGPAGAAADRLVGYVPDRIGRTRPAAVLVEGADATAVVVVAAPGDTVEFSDRLLSDPSGALRRDWTALPAGDGTAVVEVADAVAGRAAAVRVVRDGRVVGRPAVSNPGVAADRPARLDLSPVRPGTARADPILVARATAHLARPFGVDPSALAPTLLWSAELTRTGGLGEVVVLGTRVPGNAQVVTALGRLGAVRGGLAVPCGTTSVPAFAPLARLSVASVCSLSDGSDAGADRTWLVVTAPPEATTAEVLDEGGAVLDVLTLVDGGAMTRTPEDATQVRVLGADGRTVEIVPVAPAPDEPFGDYGEG